MHIYLHKHDFSSDVYAVISMQALGVFNKIVKYIFIVFSLVLFKLIKLIGTGVKLKRKY